MATEAHKTTMIWVTENLHRCHKGVSGGSLDKEEMAHGKYKQYVISSITTLCKSQRCANNIMRQ